ncbi:uncharacterized protein LOC144481668 [Mustelus asterias]
MVEMWGLCKGIRVPISAGNSSRSHNGERPFTCSDCGTGFPVSSHLRHTSKFTLSWERPFTCPVCGKGFIWFLHLQTHQCRHTGERLFICCPRAAESQPRCCGSGVTHQSDQDIRRGGITDRNLKCHVKL